MDKIRVLIVDDQTLVREGIAAVLSYSKEIEVVGQAGDGLQAMEVAQKTKPDVVLLDMVMPRQDGMTTIPLLLAALPGTRILVLTGTSEGDIVYQAIKAGALGYMLKDATREQLVNGIRDVSDGKPSMHPSVAVKMIHEMDTPARTQFTEDPLTPREMDALRLIARGLSNQEIAQEMVVHERTIAKYVSSILDKLHVANRTQAALYALREGITTLPPEPSDEDRP